MKDEYDFKESKQNPYAKKFDDIVESSWLNSLARLIKKFKTSKSYWSVSYIVILFTLREAGALVYGTILKEYVQKHLEGSDYTWLWSAIEFVFGFGGSVELVILGLFFFVVLSLVKISEGENNTISLKENFLSLLLSFAIVGMSIYMIRSNDTHHTETHKQQQITNTKLDEIKALIKLQGGDETAFLKKYFGKDYAVMLGHPQTYHNFTTLLKQTNKNADELLQEREELLKKIASQSFHPALQKQIDKAFRELRYEDARELIDGFLEANGDKEKEIIKAHYLKALSYMEEIRYHEARDEFEKIAPNIDDAEILSDYAQMYNTLGNYNKAQEYYEKSLEIKLTTPLNSNLTIATLYHELGLVSENQGKYDKSIEYLKKALVLSYKTLGENNLDTATTYNVIGSVYNKKGEYLEAKKYLEKSLKIRLRILGDKDLSITMSYNAIGLLWNNLQNYSNAIMYFEKALAINLAVLGEFHPSTAMTYNNLALSLINNGDYDNAIKYLELAIDAALPKLGQNHPNIGMGYNNLGGAWYAKRKYKKAINYYNKSLNIRLIGLNGDHPDVAMSYNNIGSAYYHMGDYSKAINYYKKALNILKKVFPAGHPNIDAVEYNLKSAKESLKNAN